MNIKLWRKEFRDDGIFGELHDENGAFVCVTLEHSYSGIPKLPPGDYVCKIGTGPGVGEFQGMHRLENGKWFNAFEVMDVPGHNDILFHIGNYNQDSKGCLLLGEGLAPISGGGQMITNSEDAFVAFMKLQEGITCFKFKVEEN